MYRKKKRLFYYSKLCLHSFIPRVDELPEYPLHFVALASGVCVEKLIY